MFQLGESDWLAVSYYLNPCKLKKILNTADCTTNQAYSRCRTSVMKNMFELMFGTVKFMIKKKYSVRYIFESYLQPNGFLPTINTKRINNLQFGFLAKDGNWKEWKIANIETIRHYWCSMLQGVAACKGFFDTILKVIIALLPGVPRMCKNCEWTVSEMYDEDLCCYCNSGSTSGSKISKNMFEHLSNSKRIKCC